MEAVQTRWMRTIPSLSQLDRKRAAEAKERWERNRNATVIDPAEPPQPVLPKPTLTAIPPKSIAAASVLAKTARDAALRDLDAQYPQYGFAAHKGYGTKAHYAAIDEFGPCPAHRPSFLRKYYEKHGF